MLYDLNANVGYLVCAIMGYLLGSFNTAYIVGRLNGRDIRRAGSHNAGATNLFIVVGFKQGLFAAICDALKAVLAVRLASWLFPQSIHGGVLAGACSLVGHAWPFWMGFRGGKGFASFLGIILATSGWGAFLGAIALAAIVIIVCDKMVFATMAVMVIYPLYMYRHGFPMVEVCIMAIAAVLMIMKHRVNLVRLIHGEELGLRQMRRRKKAGDKAEDDA